MQYIYTEEELPQRSVEWLDLRKASLDGKPRVGGSDVATLLGLMTKYEKPVTLWKRKTGKLKPKTNNSWMSRGQEMEDEAREAVKQYYTEVEGIKNPEIIPYFAIHSKYQEIAVSFDGVDLTNKFIT
jgi:putative phage-type endonuclease